MPLTHSSSGSKALMLRHEQAPNTGLANRRSEQPCRFTDLPFDVRLMLYDICLTVASSITNSCRALHNTPIKRSGSSPESRRSIELYGRTGSRLNGTSQTGAIRNIHRDMIRLSCGHYYTLPQESRCCTCKPRCIPSSLGLATYWIGTHHTHSDDKRPARHRLNDQAS